MGRGERLHRRGGLVKMFKRLIILFVFLLPIVFAGEGAIEVVSFKAYINGEPQSIEWGEDDEIMASPGDTIQIRLRLESNYDEDDIDDDDIEVDVFGQLELYDTEIERDNEDDDVDDKEISVESKKYYILDDFYLPEDLDYDFYTFTLRYEYEAEIIKPDPNNSSQNITDPTDYKHETQVDVNVKKPKEAIISRDDIITNLTQKISEDQQTIKDLLNKQSECSDVQTQLATCKETEGKYIETSEFKEKYDAECIEHDTCKTSLATCQAERQVMVSPDELDTKIANAERIAKDEQKESDNKTLFMIVIAAGAYFFYQRKKKEVGGKGESKPLKDEW